MSKDTKNKLPPGFHFFPSEEELVLHFLYNKASHLPCKPDIIPTLDFHHCDPWQLINGKALEGDNHDQWYFFTYKAEKAEDRVSGDGYWTPVTDDEPVFSGENKVGVKKSLVYCIGEAPEGIKTSWLMHEYHLLDELVSNPNPNPNCSRRGSSKKRRHSRMEDKKWVICQVFDTSYGTQDENEMELSCMDEAFLSLDDDDDDDDEISFPN